MLNIPIRLLFYGPLAKPREPDLDYASASPRRIVEAVELCERIPDRLLDLAMAALTIARGSDSITTDPTAENCLATAFVALSELLDVTREARP